MKEGHGGVGSVIIRKSNILLFLPQLYVRGLDLQLSVRKKIFCDKDRKVGTSVL